MRVLPTSKTAILLLTITLLHVGIAKAQSIGALAAQNNISDAALSNTSGNIALNTSAGNGNLQANIAVISVSEDIAKANVISEQGVVLSNKATSNRNVSEIGTNAFQNASGVIRVNQSSGNANTQANLVAIAIGKVAEVSIDQLGRVNTAQETPNGASPNSDSRKNTAVIADSAFSNARGIVQVNQLAGSGNSTANLFTLSVSVASP
ncbi:MAG: hypothetical protein ABI656_02560 [bacterium]